MTDQNNNATLPLPTHVTIAPSSAPSIAMTDQNNNATLPLPTHVTIAPSSAPSIAMPTTTTTNNSITNNSSTTPTTDGDYNEIVFVRKSPQNDTATTTPIGYYTSCRYNNNNNDTTIADIMTTQIIEFQYVITVTNTTATNTSMTTEDRGSDASVVVDTMITSIETMLHDYLVPQLLQTCRTDQDDDNLQFHSVSSLPMDMATSSSTSSSSSCITTTSPTIFPCVMTIHGAMTLETFYPPRSAKRRYLDDTTTFSDPILLERVGSLLVTFFNDTNHHLTAQTTSNNTIDINSTITTISNATNEYKNNIPPSLYHWNVAFLTITNFVSQDQPFLDTITVNTNGRNNSTNNNSNTASGIAIDQASSNQTTIDKSVGIIVVTMATTALLITLLMIAFRRRRRHHKQQRQNTSQTGTTHPNSNNNDTTLSSERDGCEHSIHNENTKNDDDDDISFILNDVMERDVESHANKVAPSRDWQVYHTTNDTPPMFISSFDDEGDMMSIVGTLPTSDDDHRWI